MIYLREGKRIIELNEIAFTEWILPIDVSSSNGNIFEDGNTALAW
jgi:hypothetical protein